MTSERCVFEMLIYLPHILEEQYPYVRQKQKLFSPENVSTNLELFRGCLGVSDPEPLYVLALAEEYDIYLDEVAQSFWINDDPWWLGAGSTDLSRESVPIGDYESLIGELVSSDHQNTLLLSDTHTSTGPTLRRCKKMNPKRSYSVLCIDAHADIYSTAEPLWRGNVFSRLIEEEVISRLFVFGVPQYRIDNVLSSTPEHIRDRVAFADHRVNGETRQKLEWLCGEEDEIFVSIDPDGLNTRQDVYTAMEYCPFQILLDIGSVSLANNHSVVADAFEHAIRPPGQPMSTGEQTHKNLYLVGEEGLSISDVQSVLDETTSILSSSGRTLGVSVGDKRLVGDIVELFGIDLCGRTTAAVRAISGALLHP